MRVASVHLTEQDLIKILQKVWPSKGPLELDHAQFAKRIVEEAKTLSCTQRSILVTNDKLQKKADKVQLVGRSDTGMFAELLVLIRRKMQHRGITIIKPGDNDWLQLKEVTKLANEFCAEFNLDKKEGYKEYLYIALKKMNKYGINKFKMLHSAIYLNYEAQVELQSDKTPDETEFCFKVYNGIINERIGHSFEEKDNIEKYVCFKKAKDEANRMKLPIRQYIVAQFEALEWVNAIPEPSMLFGSKAVERARKYCYQNNIQLTKKNLIDFNKIKK